MTKAYILINYELGSEGVVILKLKSVDGVVEVHDTFGICGILANVESCQVEALRETIIWKIGKSQKLVQC